MGNDSYGINRQTISEIVAEIKGVVDLGVQVGVVIGGGNIFRGVAPAANGMDRAQADYMGMLATVMNDWHCRMPCVSQEWSRGFSQRSISSRSLSLTFAGAPSVI